jgi:hypothetical protein
MLEEILETWNVKVNIWLHSRDYAIDFLLSQIWIHILASVKRGFVPFKNIPIFFLNPSFLCKSRIISSVSQESNFSSNIVFRNGLPRMPGLELIPGVRISEVLDGLARDVPPILVTGVVGGILDREIVLSAPGVLIRIPLDDGTLFSSAITFADKICNRENTLLITR